MEQDLVAAQGGPTTDLGGKAWTAYLAVLVFGLVLLVLAIAAAALSPWLTAGLLAIDLLIVGYRIAELRSHRLYFDDVGVWVHAGILPWRKGISGVKWRDLDEAVYQQSFWSWLLRSYTVRIGHRFTKTSEIVFPHKSRGPEAVLAIQSAHARQIRAHTLD